METEWYVIKNSEGKYYNLTFGLFVDNLSSAWIFESLFDAADIAYELEEKNEEEVTIVKIMVNEFLISRKDWE